MTTSNKLIRGKYSTGWIAANPFYAVKVISNNNNNNELVTKISKYFLHILYSICNLQFYLAYIFE